MGSSTKDYLETIEQKAYQERIKKNKKWLKNTIKDLEEVDLDGEAFYNFKWTIDNLYSKILPMRKIIELLK